MLPPPTRLGKKLGIVGRVTVTLLILAHIGGHLGSAEGGSGPPPGEFSSVRYSWSGRDRGDSTKPVEKRQRFRLISDDNSTEPSVNHKMRSPVDTTSTH